MPTRLGLVQARLAKGGKTTLKGGKNKKKGGKIRQKLIAYKGYFMRSRKFCFVFKEESTLSVMLKKCNNFKIENWLYAKHCLDESLHYHFFLEFNDLKSKEDVSRAFSLLESFIEICKSDYFSIYNYFIKDALEVFHSDGFYKKYKEEAKRKRCNKYWLKLALSQRGKINAIKAVWNSN